MTNQYSYAQDFSGKRPEVSAMNRKSESDISAAAKVYMVSRLQKKNVAANYRSGNDNGKSYMTSDDFVTYMKNRGAAAPAPGTITRFSEAEILRKRKEEGTEASRSAEPNVVGGVRLGTAKKASDAVKNTNASANKVKIYRPSQQKTGNESQAYSTRIFRKISPEKLEKLDAMKKDWFPDEKIVNRKPRKKKGLMKISLGIAAAAMSLMLIVSGSVMLSNATREVKKLDNEYKTLDQTEEALRMELDMKNDVTVLRARAAGEYGMIRKEYIEANYLDMSGTDDAKSYAAEREDKNVGISAILSAFGIK